MVSPGSTDPIDATFDELGDFVGSGDLLVVNTSATIPAAVDGRMDTTSLSRCISRRCYQAGCGSSNSELGRGVEHAVAFGCLRQPSAP